MLHPFLYLLNLLKKSACIYTPHHFAFYTKISYDTISYLHFVCQINLYKDQSKNYIYAATLSFLEDHLSISNNVSLPFLFTLICFNSGWCHTSNYLTRSLPVHSNIFLWLLSNSNLLCPCLFQIFFALQTHNTSSVWYNKLQFDPNQESK